MGKLFTTTRVQTMVFPQPMTVRMARGKFWYLERMDSKLVCVGAFGHGLSTNLILVSVPISQTLHLEQVLRLPELGSTQADVNTGSEATASITRSTIRTPRAQVKGLKMRFRPTGFGGKDTGTLGDSDSEDEQLRHPGGLGMAKGINLPSRPIRAEKRKHGDGNEDEGTEIASKKVKKHRTAEEIKRKEEKRAKKEKKREQEAATS